MDSIYAFTHIYNYTRAHEDKHMTMYAHTHAARHMHLHSAVHTHTQLHTYCSLYADMCTHLQVSNSELAINSSSCQLLQCCLSALSRGAHYLATYRYNNHVQQYLYTEEIKRFKQFNIIISHTIRHA